MAAYKRKPLPGFCSVKINQAHQFDKAYLDKMSELCTEGVRRGEDMRRPFDKFHSTCLNHPDVRQHLQQQQGHEQKPEERNMMDDICEGSDSSESEAPRGRTRKHAASASSKGDDKQAKLIQDLRNTIQNLKRSSGGGGGSDNTGGGRGGGRRGTRSGGGGGGGKDSGKGRVSIPKKLLDVGATLANLDTGCKECGAKPGDSLCFGYSLGSCSAGGKGKRCPKGWHLCGVPGCAGMHKSTQHS